MKFRKVTKRERVRKREKRERRVKDRTKVKGSEKWERRDRDKSKRERPKRARNISGLVLVYQ